MILFSSQNKWALRGLSVLQTFSLFATVAKGLPVSPTDEMLDLTAKERDANTFLNSKTVKEIDSSLAKRSLATVYGSCVKPNTVALTFDDGPYKYEKQVSDTLTNAGIKGTFFVNGNNWDCIYDEEQVDNLRYAYAAGHQVASHTWSHPDLTTLNDDDMNSELSQIEDALQKILGVIPAMMRPPYGSYNDDVRQVVADRNQSLVTWDFDSGDSTGSSAEQSNQAYDQLADQNPSNILALNHETYESTVDTVLPHAISDLQGKGYEFVTVAECLGLDPYQFIGDPSDRDDSWTC